MNKNKFISSLVCAILVSILSTNYIITPVLGFSFDNLLNFGKPEKPVISTVQNPDIIKILDRLYDKYPNINQTDIILVHYDLIVPCQDSMIEKTKNDKISVTEFGRDIINNVCNTSAAGFIEDYLDQLGVRYTSDIDPGFPPTLLSN
jgi:hypothetical protein